MIVLQWRRRWTSTIKTTIWQRRRAMWPCRPPPRNFSKCNRMTCRYSTQSYFSPQVTQRTVRSSHPWPSSNWWTCWPRPRRPPLASRKDWHAAKNCKCWGWSAWGSMCRTSVKLLLPKKFHMIILLKIMLLCTWKIIWGQLLGRHAQSSQVLNQMIGKVRKVKEK